VASGKREAVRKTTGVGSRLAVQTEDMAEIRSYNDLLVWQKGIELVEEV
jgi:hypothetical protein